jgi:3-hydroxyisobutyrate dehydrogenase-like beta-hydroxyacid dehydrogenase
VTPRRSIGSDRCSGQSPATCSRSDRGPATRRCAIVNNLLAAANLAAGAEAMASPSCGLDLRQVFDVISEFRASWIFADRVARALAGD